MIFSAESLLVGCRRRGVRVSSPLCLLPQTFGDPFSTLFEEFISKLSPVSFYSVSFDTFGLPF